MPVIENIATANRVRTATRDIHPAALGADTGASRLSVLEPKLKLDPKVEFKLGSGHRYSFRGEGTIGIRRAGSRGDDPDGIVEPGYQEILPDGTLGDYHSGIPPTESGGEPPSTIVYDVITGNEPHTEPLTPVVQNMPNIWELLP